jgi:hypothetical protein
MTQSALRAQAIAIAPNGQGREQESQYREALATLGSALAELDASS